MRVRRLIVCGAIVGLVQAEMHTIPLDPGSLKLVNVKGEQVTWKGRAAVRIIDAAADDVPDGARYAILPGTGFQDGVIEIDLTGDTLPGKGPLFRGFTGIA